MKLINTIIIGTIIFIFLIELTLRLIGFGNPILYENNNGNFYPKANQNSKRYKKANVKINHLGMRTNFSWKNYEKKKKILFFGDSVTFGGSYIDNLDLFTEKICNVYFENTICGNFGVNGYQFENIIRRIQDVEKKYYDQIIIVVSDSINPGKSIFYDFPFYEKYNQTHLKATIEVLNHFLFKYKIYDIYHHNSLKMIDHTEKNNMVNQINFIEKLSNNNEVKIFILPTLDNLDEKNKTISFLELHNLINVKLINLYDKFIIENYNDLYFNNAHLNKKGHTYIAKIIYDSIK